ncbi:sulfotransferase family protein [Psychromonas sp. psych-6C06]|uniref:sulfotransferase family protein n=1 Tax=Psychromonas sp. psych-6C06 TaxID=2058089 RepID=UPI000C330CBA|nr:sulfotransferase family protein [Psychromonas sp. psych-6C06]PKF60342.1 sulfotransferase family protein [Psychromonas sp. psych-6C06]
MSKIFIIGLPRTGTTSISVALLGCGFKVAHTAFTKQAFVLADVISDAPCFSDYPQLDALFPDSKFVYLQRDLTKWIPSMQRLLSKMAPHLLPKTGHFSPVLKRSFAQTFATEDPQLLTESHLTACYLRHEQQVEAYFTGRQDLLTIDISEKNSLQALMLFLGLTSDKQAQFPHLNKGTQVANWKAYKHANKINSHSAGPDHRQFFDY